MLSKKKEALDKRIAAHARWLDAPSSRITRETFPLIRALWWKTR